jgi:hypothetical protein
MSGYGASWRDLASTPEALLVQAGDYGAFIFQPPATALIGVPSLDRRPPWSPLAGWVPNRVNRPWPQEFAKHGSSISTTLRSLLFKINFNMADEIAENFDLFGIVIRYLYASEFIFDHTTVRLTEWPKA